MSIFVSCLSMFIYKCLFQLDSPLNPSRVLETYVPLPGWFKSLCLIGPFVAATWQLLLSECMMQLIQNAPHSCEYPTNLQCQSIITNLLFDSTEPQLLGFHFLPFPSTSYHPWIVEASMDRWSNAARSAKASIQADTFSHALMLALKEITSCCGPSLQRVDVKWILYYKYIHVYYLPSIKLT